MIEDFKASNRRFVDSIPYYMCFPAALFGLAAREGKVARTR